MRHIDKTLHQEVGNRITEDYINDVKAEDPLSGEVHYMVDYDGTFRSLPDKQHSYYKQMLRAILDNQYGYCCYCMRRIVGEFTNPSTGKTDSDTTLEHIVPQASNEAHLDYYHTSQLRIAHNEEGMVEQRDIVLTKHFTHADNPPFPPYPHTVAYRNLVASCKGMFPSRGQSACCCNNVRGNEDAFPVYYLTEAESYIEYTKEGSIVAVQSKQEREKVATFIKSAKLHCSSLIDIRQMWYLLRTTDMVTLHECTVDEDKRNILLSSVLYTPAIDAQRRKVLLRKFLKDNEWETLMLYDYFHGVFNNVA